VTADLVKDTQLREEISRHNLARKESTQSGHLDPVCPVGISSGQENKEDPLDEKDQGKECEPLQSGGVTTEEILGASLEVVSSCQEDNFVENVVLESKKAKTEISVTEPSDISKQVETVTTLPTSSLIETNAEVASVLKPSEVLPEEVTVEVSIDSGTNLSDPAPVQKTIEEEVNPPKVNLVKDNIETDLQIDEVAKVHPEDKAISNTIVPEGVDLCTEDLKIDNSELVCDNNIPGGSEGSIHSEENSSSKSNSPVKICLKGNFEKLSEKVKLFDLPKYQSEADLEMFEKNLSTQADDSDQIIANAEEVRIVKMVEDLDKKEKIVRIIEELDKTKSMTKRRMSGEVPGPDKRLSPPKPVEAAPITNALQGLQALLKMSKMTDPSSSSTKETDSNSSEKKSGRSRNLSGTSSKSSHGDHHDVRSRRKSGSHEHKSRKGESKSRHGDHKSRHSDPPSLTRINRSALVRDRQVETHSKSLVEEQNNKKNVVEDLQAVSNTKSGHHDYYESGRSRNKFQSFQMKDIRKRLLPGSSSINTISSRASEVAKRKGKEEDEEVKVLSYRMVKPKIEEDNHERIIRKVEDPSTVQKTIKNKTESASKLNSSLEGAVDKVSRKVTEVPKVMKVMPENIPVEEELQGAVKPGQSSQTKSEATLNLFQKSIVKIQSQENTDNLRTPPERRKSLDLIKEELERVTSKVNDIKKKSSSREISSDDDMKVIMKDVQTMERDVDDISQETENGRRSKSKKKKHKDDKKKKKKEKYTGDIAIDSRIAKKIISRIISSDMGKSFNEVIKREVGETESTIEKLREDLRKKSSQENKSKKKNKKDKSREGKEKKKKKKDRHGDEENPRDESIKKKKRSKERSASPPADTAVADQMNKKLEEEVSVKVPSSKIESSKIGKSPDKNSKKRKSSSPVRFYDQVPEVATQETSKLLPYDSEGKKAKKIKKKKSKKKHKRNKEKDEKEDSVETEGNNLVDNQPSAFVESKTENKERIVRKKSSSPIKDFELVLGVTEEDLLDETVSSHVTKTDILSDSVTETEVDTTIDENDCTDNVTDISTSVIDAALEDIPTREFPAEAILSNTNSGATSSANSEDEQSEDEDNLRALLLSQLSKTRCGPKAKTKKRSSNPSKAPNSKITKISWSSPPPEPVEVSSTTPAVPVPATSTPSYPPLGSLPVYAYAYSRTFITPAEKLLYFPNLYNRILVPLDLDSDSDSDCHSDCDSFWGEKRTSQWVSERMSYSESDPRFSQANLNLVMRARDSCSPAPL